VPVERASSDQLDELGTLIRTWAESAKSTNEAVLAVDQLPMDRRWFIRLAGDEKQYTTIWFHLRERTLHFETQFMPSPEENREQLFEYLLRLNNKLFGVRFSIGDEDAIYLMGQLPWSAVDEDELDRIVGSAYAYTEQYFRPAMRIGYQSKFKG
jgi:hypothetical protein